MPEAHVELSLPSVRDTDAEGLMTTVLALGQPSLRERGVEGARDYLEQRAAAAPPGPAVEQVTDEAVLSGRQRVAVRVYRGSQSQDLPVVVYFHGGGWVMGSLATADAFCRRLARAAEAVVVSVDYPLAPEHPYPAAVDAAVAAIEWAGERAATWRGDASRLVVLGDSAGGNIATVAVRRLVQGGRQLVCRQVLAYPGVSAERGSAGGPFGGTWPLTDEERVWFLDQYAPDPAPADVPDVAPLLADVSGLPATTLLLAGCDVLFSEGLDYASHLWSAGVPVDLHVYAGQIHGFLTFDESVLPTSREALGVVVNAIRNAG